MITIFDFLSLVKTKQIIEVIYYSKSGKRFTVKGEAFRVMNSCMDIGIGCGLISDVTIKGNEILICSTFENANFKRCV